MSAESKQLSSLRLTYQYWSESFNPEHSFKRVTRSRLDQSGPHSQSARGACRTSEPDKPASQAQHTTAQTAGQPAAQQAGMDGVAYLGEAAPGTQPHHAGQEEWAQTLAATLHEACQDPYAYFRFVAESRQVVSTCMSLCPKLMRKSY